MRSRKQTPPALNGDHVDEASIETHPTPVDALALAEEAEAEAAEADAVAAAARARARALRLRREAEQAKAAETVAAPEPDDAAGQEDDTEDEKEDAAEADAGGSDETAADTSDDAAIGEHDETAVGEHDETAVGEPEEQPAAERRGLRIRIPLPSWKSIAAALTVLIIAALLTGCGYIYWNHRQAQAEVQHRAEFEAAARQGVVTLMSLDFNRAKEDVQRIIDSSTGQFKTDFQNTADDFVKVATESKAVTETNVTATAVETMDTDTATVLVAATSRVTNAAGAKQEPRAWRLSVNLARDGGQLKLAKVEFVP
jgi:Mce-associated membrane protein